MPIADQEKKGNNDDLGRDAFLSESGPDHNKEFEVAAFVNGEQYESAWGRNKKEAEQKAAFNALVSLEQLDES